MAFETAVHVKSMVVFAVDPVGEVATAGLLLSHVVAFCASARFLPGCLGSSSSLVICIVMLPYGQFRAQSSQPMQ